MGARGLLKNGIPPLGRDRHAQDKNAKSGNSSAIATTEDEVWRRPVRPGGQDSVLQQPARQAVVCDASVLAAMIFGEPRSAEAHALTHSRRLFAPSLLRYEMAHVAVRHLATAGCMRHQVEQAFAASLRVPMRIVEPSWPAVLDLARANRLSAYDASYLQLALALRLPLATLDEQLGLAAEGLGIEAQPTA